MTKRNIDHEFDDDEIRDADPTGEDAFAETGFQDADDGGPVLEAPGLETEEPRRPDTGAQKVAGPESRQKEPTTTSPQRPETNRGVIRERGGESKGDPAVGGTRPD